MAGRTLKLKGPGMRGARASGALLADLMPLLVDSCQRTIRLQVEGRSAAGGPAPAWLQKAAEFELVGMREGSTELLFEAPALAEAAPDQFAQASLFSSFDPGASCLDLLAASLADAAGGRRDSERYDDKLVATFEGFGKLLRHGIEQLELEGPTPVLFNAASLETIKQLRRETPSDQGAIVEGKLDELRFSSRAFSLLLDDGAALRGLLVREGIEPGALGALWGQRVRFEGLIKFRPSGRPLRLEAERFEAVAQPSPLWSEMPRPILDGAGLSPGPRVGEPGGRPSFLAGPWPDDESDEEFEAAVQALS